MNRYTGMTKRTNRVPTAGHPYRNGIVCALIIAGGTWADTPIDEVISRLTARTDATYRYQHDAAIGYEIRRDQLLNSKTVTVAPTLFSSPRALSDGSLEYGTTATYSSPKIYSSVSVISGEKAVQTGSAQLLYTILSDTKGRAVQIDSVIALTRKKAELIREAMIFNDLKQLLTYRASEQHLADESAVRTEITVLAEQYLARLQKIVATGAIPRNAVQSLQLFIKNNKLRREAIALEQNLIRSTVAYQFGIDSTLFRSIDLNQILRTADLAAGSSISDYTWKIDSLNNAIQRKSVAEQNGNAWKLSAGGGVSFSDPADPSLYTTSAIAQVQYTFNRKRVPDLLPLQKAPTLEFSPNDSTQLASYEQSVNVQAKEATAWIAATLERIALGETGSIYEISDNLGAIQNHRLAYTALKNSSIQRELLRFRSMDQLKSAGMK